MSMREEFEAAYVEEMVRRLSEGYRSSALYSMSAKEQDGDYLHTAASQAWWAWQASRAAIEVELPTPMPKAEQAWNESAQRVEDTRTSSFNRALRESKKAIEAAGLKVKS